MSRHQDQTPAPLDGIALLCVDCQADFLPGGALAVPDGDAVLAPLAAAAARVGLVLASRDWHPAAHSSFAAQGGPWPAHCVQGSAGAELDPAIAAIADVVVDKATATAEDAYSAFQGTKLADRLFRRGISVLLVGGLATDYCVKATVLDALDAGFEVRVLTDCVRAVEARPGDGARALRAMKRAGAELVRSDAAAAYSAPEQDALVVLVDDGTRTRTEPVVRPQLSRAEAVATVDSARRRAEGMICQRSPFIFSPDCPDTDLQLSEWCAVCRTKHTLGLLDRPPEHP